MIIQNQTAGCPSVVPRFYGPSVTAVNLRVITKKERLGILLGRVSRGVALVEQAVVYYGGPGTRTSAFVDPCKFEPRVNVLLEASGLEFLGSFHTHVEVNNSISSVPSPTDKIPLCDDPPSFIEIIAAIWASDASVQPSNCYLQGGRGGYRYRMAGYDYRQGFRILPVFSEAA